MDALRQRLSVLSERYLAERLGIGLRTLRRSFLDERGVTAYVALRQRGCRKHSGGLRRNRI